MFSECSRSFALLIAICLATGPALAFELPGVGDLEPLDCGDAPIASYIEDQDGVTTNFQLICNGYQVEQNGRYYFMDLHQWDSFTDDFTGPEVLARCDDGVEWSRLRYTEPDGRWFDFHHNCAFYDRLVGE